MSECNVSGWQPIETAPEEGQWALVYADGAQNCAFVQKGRLPKDWCNSITWNIMPEFVTHWMPLPPPPSE